MQSNRNIALVATLLISVGLLFFFHMPGAGFQASHGPTSTLKEHDRSLAVQIATVVLPLMFYGNISRQIEQSFVICRLDDESALTEPAGGFNLLRC